MDVEPVAASAPHEAPTAEPPLLTEQATDLPAEPELASAAEQEPVFAGPTAETANPAVGADAPAEQLPAKAPTKNNKRGGKKKGKGGRR